MADDEEEQTEIVAFHPCHTPRGMQWYDLSILTAFQQSQLNELKTDVIRDNQKYLAEHPEIRALIAIFLKEVFRSVPITRSIATLAKDFFGRPIQRLEDEMAEYMTNRGEPLNREGDSAVNLYEKSEGSESSKSMDMSLYYPQYFSYVSYTDEQASEEMEEEMTEEDYPKDYQQEHFMYDTDTEVTTALVTGTTTTSTLDKFSELTALQVTPAISEDEVINQKIEAETKLMTEALLKQHK